MRPTTCEDRSVAERCPAHEQTFLKRQYMWAENISPTYQSALGQFAYPGQITRRAASRKMVVGRMPVDAAG